MNDKTLLLRRVFLVPKHTKRNDVVENTTENGATLIPMSNREKRLIFNVLPKYTSNSTLVSRLKKSQLIVMLLCIGLMGSFDASSQTFPEWMQLLAEKSAIKEKFRMDIDVIASYTKSGEILYQSSMKVLKDRDRFYYQTEDAEVVGAADLQLRINHPFKVIEYYKAEGEELLNMTPFDLDSILAQYPHAALIDEDDRYVYFEVIPEKGGITRVEMTINKQAREMETLSYYYSMNEEEVVVETSFKSGGLDDDDYALLDLSKIVHRDQEKLTLTNQYQDYYLHAIN